MYDLNSGGTVVAAAALPQSSGTNPRLTSNGVDKLYICCGSNTKLILSWDIFTTQLSTYRHDAIVA